MNINLAINLKKKKVPISAAFCCIAILHFRIEMYLLRSNEITPTSPGGFGVVGTNLPRLQGL